MSSTETMLIPGDDDTTEIIVFNGLGGSITLLEENEWQGSIIGRGEGLPVPSCRERCEGQWGRSRPQLVEKARYRVNGQIPLYTVQDGRLYFECIMSGGKQESYHPVEWLERAVEDGKAFRVGR